MIRTAVVFSFFCAPLFSFEHVYLKTPSVSQEEMIGSNVGIRPYRNSGVRLEAETLGGKLLIHNYGYGGSGLTLSFGSASAVLEILNSQKNSSNRVAVLGAGVIGLATAYELLQNGYQVRIYASQWSPYLTSNVAAGIWSPYPAFPWFSEEKQKLHQRLLEISEHRFLKSVGENPEFAGIRHLCSYSFKSGNSEEAIKTKHRGEEVVVHFDNGIVKNGHRVQEIGIDGKLFMDDLFAKVKSSAGAILEERHFGSIEELLDLEEPIIINCMSLGSREIFNDQEFLLARGQIVYLTPQPDIDYVFYQNIPGNSNRWVSIYPWSDRLIVGGIYEWEEEALAIDPEVIGEIIQSARQTLFGEQ